MENADNAHTVLVDERLESCLETVDSCEERAKQEAEKAGIPEEDAYQVGYAVREAVVNAVVHGNQYSANKLVHFVVARSGNALQIEVEDEGRGFLPADQVDPLAQENLLNQSGRGIMIIRAFVDDMQISNIPSGGTRLVMKKNIPAGT